MTGNDDCNGSRYRSEAYTIIRGDSTVRHADNAAIVSRFRREESGRKRQRMPFPGSILGECKASARAESQCIRTYMRFEHADNAAIV